MKTKQMTDDLVRKIVLFGASLPEKKWEKYIGELQEMYDKTGKVFSAQPSKVIIKFAKKWGVK